MNEVVLVQSDKYIKNAVSIVQYTYFNKKLITIIGEYHTTPFSCQDKAIEIGEYAHAISTNDWKSRVFLEYDKNRKYTDIDSHSINSVCTALKGHLNIEVIPFDFRPYFLTLSEHERLYSSKFLKIDRNDIPNLYIEPFYINFELFQFNEQNYPPVIYNFMLNEYIKGIDENLKWVAANYLLAEISEIHRVLRDAWMAVADFFLIRELLMLNSFGEDLVIIGKRHVDNIMNVFRHFTEIIVLLNFRERHTPSDSCLSFYKAIPVSLLVSDKFKFNLKF